MVTIRQLDGEFSTVPVENGSAAAPSIYFKDSGTDSGFFSPGTDAVAISTAGTNRLHITSGGLVGIGTSTVSTILNIRSNSSDDGILLEKNDGTGVARLFFDGTSSDARLDMFSGGVAKIQLKANGDSHFSGGNVGIGSATPGRLLQVSNTSGDPFISILGAASNNGGLLFGDNASDAVGQIRYGHDVDAMYFTINGAERFRCDSSGRLLVGTSVFF
jgi:hypothetical protein